MRCFLLYLFILGLFAGPVAAQTQLDPSFLPQRLYRPAKATAVLQLSSGARLVFGATRADHYDVPGLAAYTASGQFDTQFNANLAGATWRNIIGGAEALGGKIWLVAEQATYGTTSYFQLVRLNADGSRDPGFAPKTTIWGSISAVVQQPDGKVVVSGGFSQPGTPAVLPMLRFNADGTPDTAFNNRIINSPYAYFYSPGILLQPDGKLLLALQSTVLRFNDDGSVDASFRLRNAASQPLSAAQGDGIGSMALQPDGRLLIGAFDGNTNLFYGEYGYIFRFSTTGVMDGSFRPNINLCPRRCSFIVPTMVVRPTGQVVLGVDGVLFRQLPVAHQYVAQLLPNGNLDTSWQYPTNFLYGISSLNATSLQLLPSGQVLVAGELRITDTALNLPTGVRLLEPTGAAAITSFVPLLQDVGYGDGTVLGPNGKIIVGGVFSEINGTATRQLACLTADGRNDAGFAARSPFTSQVSMQQVVRPLFTYPDGRILVGGSFQIAVNGQQHSCLARLMPNGRIDSSFVSMVFGPNSLYGDIVFTSTAGLQGGVFGARLQPSGKIVVLGRTSNPLVGGPAFIARLTADGQLDASFQSAAVAPRTLLMRPDGRLLVATAAVAATGQAAGVTALLADGSPDASFATASVANGSTTASINQIVAASGDNVLVQGLFTTVNGATTYSIARLLPNGTVDPSFVVSPTTLQAATSGEYIFGLAVQPNQRVLVGGFMLTPGRTGNQSLLRLLPNGQLDVAFGLTVQADGLVSQPVVQPNGAILISGPFTEIATQQHLGLARLLDSNVLHVASQQTESATTAWPVPTHGDLHLTLDANAHPQQVQLLDALGRVVLTQAVGQPTLTVSTSALPAGTYLLRVRYAASTVTRRVVVE